MAEAQQLYLHRSICPNIIPSEPIHVENKRQQSPASDIQDHTNHTPTPNSETRANCNRHMKHFEPAAPVEGCTSKRVRCIHCSWTGAKNVSQQLHHLAVVCPTFSTVPEYQDEWRILVRNLPSSQLKTKKSKQAHALALQSCLPNSVLDGGLDAQEMRGDEPSGKRAKRAENQSRTQNPNLSRALEHIMQVAAEAQDAQSSSPMLRQAVRDEEVSHILRQILKEIKGLREDTKRQTEETREVSKLLKDFLGSRIPSQDLSGRPSNGSK